MIKNNKLKLILSSVVILLPILVGLIFWNELPAQMSTHWGIDGTVNGKSSVYFAVFGLPLILLALQWLCLLLSSLDPRNKEQSSKALKIVIWIIPLLSLFVNGIIYATAFGKTLNPIFIMPILLGLTFLVIGNYMPKFRQSYTLGIKIKWTLRNEENWNATHRFAGKLWVIGGILMLFSALLPFKITIFVMFGLIVLLVAVPTVFSYTYYRKQVKNGTAALSEAPELKYKKSVTVVSVIAVIAISIFVFFIMFTGKIEIAYNDNSFTVDSSYWNELTVEYSAIDSVEYREDFDKGTRVSGLGSASLLVGMFYNEEFGNYTLYSYTKCNSAVIIKADSKVLVIGDTTPDSTKEIYEQLVQKAK